MTKILSLAFTLAAYTDTVLGLEMRAMMVMPISHVDAGLAAYIALNLHF